ncbi:hypothetical protein EVAR_54764_1 [Eumeta japonica]|uniref:Uncharacterized protein n=1 Tax=Eumeta variegata TaxID=151549 RepID=A0A4C1YE03_EUMVA|nr:hypothetical protein EVAR_54764_1 [Eumeta japonica]
MLVKQRRYGKDRATLKSRVSTLLGNRLTTDSPMGQQRAHISAWYYRCISLTRFAGVYRSFHASSSVSDAYNLALHEYAADLAELVAAVRRRGRGDASDDDEDLGLPRSPPASPPTDKADKSSNFDIKDESRRGQPVTDKVDAILEKLEQDGHISSYDIVEELNIDQKIVMTHLKKKLDIQKSSILETHTSLLKEI